MIVPTNPVNTTISDPFLNNLVELTSQREQNLQIGRAHV